MNRSEVITLTAEGLGESEAMVEKVVTTFFDIVADALMAGDVVKVRRFGKFEPRLRAAQTKPNPRSGDVMEIPERISVAFLPSDLLKDKLNS